MVIAIDGPSGSGKSTIARAVAAALGVAYLNTGAYYRAATLAALRAGADLDDAGTIVPPIRAASFDFFEDHMLLDGSDVSEEIRGPAVTAAVSLVSAIPEVRLIMVERQRAWVAGRGGDVVVEGRDIGTVVFPDAAVKVFLTASEQERARRRAADAESRGQAVEAVADQMRRRDEIDSTRDVSPLVPAPDAVVVDTTGHGIGEVVSIVLRLVHPA